MNSGGAKLLLEPFQVPDVYADDTAEVYVVNNNVRWTLYRWQTIPPETEPVKVAVAHVIMPLATISGALGEILRIANEALVKGDGMSVLTDTVARPSLLS